MSALLILPPLAIDNVVGDGVNPGNLLTADPREVWTSPNAATVNLTVNLAAPATVDTLYLGYAYLGQASAVRVSAGGAQIGAATFSLPRFNASRPAHALVQFDGPVTAQTFTVAIDLAAGDRPLSLGVLMVGAAFRPTWNYEWGAGRTPIDTGTRTAFKLGGFGIDRGVVKSGWQWSLGDLSDDELDALYAIVIDRGETAPVLVVENPDATRPGLCERIHYATFDRLEAFERRDAGLTRWALRVEDWL